MSRIGEKPVIIPKDVKVEVKDREFMVTGPKGTLAKKFSDRIKIEVKEDKAIISRIGDVKTDKALHGLYRALLANMIKGVTEGYVKELEIQGVGFKAQAQGNVLNLQLSFSHPVNVNIPEGIKIETPKLTQIIVRGIDKELVGKIASEIRAILPPEPYKGKGIRYAGEYVKKKVGKAQATGGAK